MTFAFLNDQQFSTKSTTLIALDPSKLNCYQFTLSNLHLVQIDRCGRGCVNLDDFFDILCVVNKKEDSYLKVSNMIVRLN